MSSQMCESISSLNGNVEDIKAVFSGLTEEQKSVLMKSLQWNHAASFIRDLIIRSDFDFNIII